MALTSNSQWQCKWQNNSQKNHVIKTFCQWLINEHGWNLEKQFKGYLTVVSFGMVIGQTTDDLSILENVRLCSNTANIL